MLVDVNKDLHIFASKWLGGGRGAARVAGAEVRTFESLLSRM